jgi:hypothetical protein
LSYCRFFLLAVALAALLAGVPKRKAAAADEWLPISPEELKMTSEAKAPGAPALVLYRQVDRDESSATTSHEYNYVRIKILTEEGRKYADVEIPYVRDSYTIHNIRARTVRPDGSVANFDGKVYDKEIVKARGVKILAKTFTLSDVQLGSLIEYHYMVDFAEYKLFDSHWALSEELFTKHGKFSLKPYGEFALQWSWPNGLPQGTKPPAEETNHVIRMETQDVPAFVVEDDMPPEDLMKFRVDFTYSQDGFEKEPEKFWKKHGKKMNDRAENFVNKRKAMEQAVASIVSSGDSPDRKLEKIYARCQQIRNTTYELERTEQEQKRAKEKQISNIEDVWKSGRGDGDDITLLFLGLVRAAGLEAYAVQVSTRDQHFFSKNMMRASDLNTYVVLVKVNGKDLYFDPGTLFVPFGLLPWSETSVPGLKLDKDGGSWIQTPAPDSQASQIQRKADMKLTGDGSLEGKLTVTYSGLEASSRRVEQHNQDEVNRKKFLEDEVRAAIPVGIDVDLTNKPDWTSSSSPLIAEFTLKVPGWVSGAGRRALLPVGLFSAPEKHLYEHTSRVHPLYFHYMSTHTDDVMIQLPLDWQVNSLPSAVTRDAKLLLYSMKVEKQAGGLHLERQMRNDLLSLDQNSYPILRNFYQAVRTADDQQIVLQPGSAAASN